MNMGKEALQKQILFSGLRKQPAALACRFPPKGTHILPLPSVWAQFTTARLHLQPRAPETGKRGQACTDFSRTSLVSFAFIHSLTHSFIHLFLV